MLPRPSLLTRVIVGKTVGFVVGLAGFLTLPLFLAEPEWMLRFAVLCWYTTIGAFIGMVGVFNYHPILHIPLPWWFRAPLIGAWMNLVLVLFAHDMLADLMLQIFGADGVFRSPFWFILEGALVGLLIGALATRLGGEGPATALADGVGQS